MAEKLFYSMGEVAEMFDVNPSLLRHWETQFSVLRPRRNKKGNRLYAPGDIENLKLIYHLVKECGMTLDGARKAFRQARGSGHVSRDMELLERLQRVRAMLAEVRAELTSDGGEIVADDTPSHDPSDALPNDGAAEPVREAPAARPAQAVASDAGAEPALRRGRRKAVVKIGEEPDGAASAAEPDAAKPAGARRTAARNPRRRKEDAEHKELFAFYEQSLF